ncbi:helix-turn-helix transcriptional regulator, partial [Streptomyces sp. B1866]|uniref:helix-turn-helix domain-containing protein n=1 Tax=Streptomyces sp. B1866 TaxID=3075431 RepID=UPI00288C6E5D
RLAARAPHGRGPAGPWDPAAGLTGRERQIAELVGDGLTNRLIGKRLHIAEKTVEMHLSNVFAKLGVANRAAVAALITRAHQTAAGAGAMPAPGGVPAPVPGGAPAVAHARAVGGVSAVGPASAAG